MKTILLGLGNPILTDDGVGVYVVEAVEGDLPPSAEITVRAVSVGGLRLMEEMIGFERAVIVDAWRCDPAAAGAWRRLTLAELTDQCPTRHSLSDHDTNLATALAIGRRLDLPLPRDVTVFAVDVANLTDFGDSLSPAVAEAVPAIVAAVRQELLTHPSAARSA